MAVICPGPGAMAAMQRLLRALNRWRRRRAKRNGGRLQDFMALSDRTLADIGLRRADVHAALIGAIPLGRRPTVGDDEGGGSRCEAAVCRMPCRPRPATVANDLSDAA
jgi:uncharacterized protein YjiS (DUF1127 family)